MTTFDGWDARGGARTRNLFGEWHPDDELMHFRTRGSKNGVRRYQNPDGSWTPLGLRERRAREGWGEGEEGGSGKTRSVRSAERKPMKRYERAMRQKDKEERKAKAKAEFARRKGNRDLSKLSDEELKKRIERIKLEKEYRELNKNPLVESAAKLVNSYFKAKDNKLAREEKRYQLENSRMSSMAALINAKARKKEANRRHAKADLAKSRAELKKQKNEERKHTIRGAFSENIGNIMRKSGSRFVKGMSDTALSFRVARGGKTAAKAVGRGGKKAAIGIYNAARNRGKDIAEGYMEGMADVRYEKIKERDSLRG